MIQLELKAKHFKDTKFCGTGHCAIEKAAKDIFGNVYVIEEVNKLTVRDKEYSHEDYGVHLFNADRFIANASDFDETVIRTLTLTPCATT